MTPDPLIVELVAARRGQGISQVAVAARLGCAQPSVCQFETGLVSSTIERPARYAAAIGHRIVVRPDHRTIRPIPLALAKPTLITDSAGLVAVLRRVRLSLNWSCQQAAAFAGLPAPSVRQWESGLHRPRLRGLHLYMGALGFVFVAERNTLAVAS